MPIKYWGKGIDKKPNNNIGWFAQSLIPVFSVDDIPTSFKADIDGNIINQTRTINPFLLYEKGSAEDKLLAPWTATYINLNDFQIEMLWGLKEGKEPGETLPEYADAYNNTSYIPGSTPELAGTSIPQQFKDKKKFVIEKIYLASSAEYMAYTREIRRKNPNYSVIDSLLWWNIEPSFLEAEPFYTGINMGLHGVYYAVGYLETILTTDSILSFASLTEQDIIAQPETPQLTNIIRNPEDFSQAVIRGSKIGKTNTTNQAAEIKVKFVFDNGVEKYAEIINIENKEK